ncbi:SH3 domain containing protein [Talaromyces stipitatus ATCC 10500]|uniref:SH3 domain containing protein n=1 Tax=Talaromyces stipitatus (strain ATCC 10500 / CBS 375.48 / QM 6759 / NRRL 1006) TaxID=441959 RepID=B8MR25_TALSN|nr:SH3 domain containing protein [Talaromyces stipitatus ATCC 10500]EED12920.1 SH3 domain containing protein [Talaromyces stipitatus ATCC 10500]
MQSMHRQFGKLMKRSADDSQVSVLLKDFDNADKLLTKIIESTKAWRDAWISILTYQGRLVQEFETVYAPIVGSSEGTKSRPAVETPKSTLERVNRLSQEFESLRTDLLVDVNAVDDRMIRPFQQAKDYLAPLKKTIKKREDKKLDYEHFQNRVDNSMKKAKRSDRDNAVLAKAEADLAKAKEEYSSADDNLRQHLPPLITAVFSLVPYFLASQIELQNALLGHYYTVLHTYAQDENFQSPPPPMEDVIQVWKSEFLPIQQEIESFTTIANGKAVRGDDDRRNGSHSNGFGVRRPSYNHQISATSPSRNLAPPAPNLGTKPKIGQTLASSPSAASSYLSVKSPSPAASTPEYASDHYSTPMTPGQASGGSRGDYFSRGRQPSSGSTTPGSMLSTIGKKKPPPPPPPRAKSAHQAVYVTALYDFGGQGEGDLVFREGDRIRVIKKTDSTDDWWEGELHGVQGSFPANYCR